MKLLFDACVARQTAEALVAAGYDVDWVGNWPESPADSEIWKRLRRLREY